MKAALRRGEPKTPGLMLFRPDAADRLFGLLKPGILEEKPLAYAQLTPDQQGALAAALICTVFSDLSSRQNFLLAGILRPHQSDPANLDISQTNREMIKFGTFVATENRVLFVGSFYPVDPVPSDDPRAALPENPYHRPR